MLPTSEILALIEHLYAAAAGGCHWIEAVAAIIGSLGAERGGVVLQDPAGAVLLENTAINIEDSFRLTYGPLITSSDMRPVWARITRDGPPNGIVDEIIGSGPDLDRSAFNEEWLKPLRVDRYLMAAMSPFPGQVGFLIVGRSADGGPFGDDVVTSIQALRPHVVRAMQLRHRLNGVAAARLHALAALDHVAHGVLLLDAWGHVRHANKLADAIIDDHDGLRVEHGMLSCDRADDTAFLRRAIGLAAGPNLQAPAVLTVRRGSGRRPLSLMLAPLRGRPDWSSAPETCCVVVTDAERVQPAPAGELRRLYGLTAAEARLALALLDCDRLADVAQKLSVSLSTTRTLLQRVFVKTDTHRQAQLVRLLMAHRLPTDDTVAASG